ncbi:MAG TPA: AAA family ATPase [Candidatus Acidoferrum sp.]|nr:AAA family ATPase [Candidatus Acidoferrum sp.]
MPTAEYTEKAAGQAAIFEFFALREQPFGVTPDPRFLYLTASHREALASLIYGVESKRGFSALIAEPGMGKTTLLFYLLDKLKSTARTAFLFRPDSNTKELLQSLLLDLGLETNPEDVPQMHETLKSALLDDLRQGRHFVWVIDEAQDLDSEVLESIRLLSNFETPASKLMHILLAGQPALSEKLASQELLQLRQRISIMAQLSPLSMTEASEYARFRIRRAGGKDGTLFSPESLSLIARASQGIPRNINHLCFSCLSLGFVEKQRTIQPEIVRQVLAEKAENESADRSEATMPPPPSLPPGDFENFPVLPNLVHPVPRRTSLWLGSFVILFFVIPIFLVAVETNSRLADVLARTAGYETQIPDLPDVLPAALQPPKPPVPLPDSERRLPATTSPTDMTTTPETGYLVSKEHPSQTNDLLAEKKPQSGATRVIFARGGDTLTGLAYRYYGKSNDLIVAKIRSHNPQIKSTYTVLLKNQPVVLPDLAPEFPWKGSSLRAGR